MMTSGDETMNRRSPKGGFSLIEILAVMAVIAVLTGIMLFVGRGAAQRADIAQTHIQMQKLMGGLTEYRVRNGEYPTALSVINTALYMPPADYTAQDPWGRNYEYVREAPNRAFIWSRGPMNAGSATDPRALRSDRPQ
jgi:prepilin-type N-terminal cleavage/methylation domain-containing protein